MDLLLTHGYFLQEDEAEKRIMKPYPTLGILYISAYLKAKGFGATVFDSTFETRNSFCRYIDQEHPSIVGIYSNLMTKLAVLELLRYCKSKGCIIVVGGPDVPEYVDEYLAYGADVAVLGEGEETMVELVPTLLLKQSLGQVAGIAFLDERGTTVRTKGRPLIKELDTIPLPDRDSIDIMQYIETWRRYHGMGSVSLICARGCPYTCTWCSRSVFGETHRRRTAKNVVNEIESIRERYKPDMLWFADDVFTIHQKWFYELHEEMKRRHLKIPFECISRADRLNDDILEKMADIGSFRIWIGSESGSQRVLDSMQRRVTLGEIQNVTKLARKHKIQIGLFVMLGYPGEEISDIEKTVNHLKQTNADAFLTTVAYPIKGTALFEEVADRIIRQPEWARITDRNIRFSGRYSDRFYWFANRYLVNEVGRSQLNHNGNKSLLHSAGTFAKAKLAHLGMHLTKRRSR